MAGDGFWMALTRCMSEKGSYANGRGYWLLMSLMILLTPVLYSGRDDHAS